MGEVKEVSVEPYTFALPSMDWGDAYQTRLERPFNTAREAGSAIVESFPGWMQPMLRLRDAITSLAGLKGTDELADQVAKNPNMDAIGFFPIVSETQLQLVAGTDDKHLDFRIVIDLQSEPSRGQLMTLATVLKRHNWGGRAYLATIRPFHIAACKGSLRNMARIRRAS